jgi:2-polyprenyl-3-methyl-5-hydroxy-6-metoxy-1,4-benzoquinol methylase
VSWRPTLHDFEAALERIAPFMLTSYRRQRDTFGDKWAAGFNATLQRVIAPSPEALGAAVKGYANFAIDGMRLQRKFNKTRRYEARTYDEASRLVYQNPEYMFGLYLPGILLSHYLWEHHYRQLLFFEAQFAPLIRAAPDCDFVDIGPGTGFYSRQFLAVAPDGSGRAFDISPSSLEYSRRHVEAFGYGDRWTSEQRDVVTSPAGRRWPFLLNVEVLEHLEDPLTFLRALREMLEPDGKAFITAAVTAPNEDHIYLYNTPEEVREQLEEAGFRVCAEQFDRAYEPQGDEPVPINAAFIVTS